MNQGMYLQTYDTLTSNLSDLLVFVKLGILANREHFGAVLSIYKFII